jgi:hypothetical protein
MNIKPGGTYSYHWTLFCTYIKVVSARVPYAPAHGCPTIYGTWPHHLMHASSEITR